MQSCSMDLKASSRTLNMNQCMNSHVVDVCWVHPQSVDKPFHTNDLRKEFHVTKPKKGFLCIWFLGLYILNIYLCMFYFTIAGIVLNLF